MQNQITMNLRRDVLAKVTGKAVYANDLHLEGMLHLAVVRANISSGRILKIDKVAASKVPGVEAIFVAADIPGIPSLPCERPVLCADRVRYVGDAVALVAAKTREAAYEAAELVTVDFEPLESVLDPGDALQENAPLVHEEGNLIARYITVRGDAKAAIDSAPYVLEREFTTQRVQHVSMETEACVATYDPMTGKTLVRCPVNSPFPIRKVVAETLGCPQNMVRVVLTTIGGTFGGKNYDTAMAASRAALASKLTGKPCKIVLTREESIQEGTKRHPLRAKYRVGFDEEGMLLGMEVNLLLDGGAYKSKTHPVTSRMAIEATGPYYVPNVSVVSESVYTNNVPSDALRGFGSPQVDYCSETLMEEIASCLGKDSLEIRRKNMLKQGGLSSFGQVMKDVTLGDCLEELDRVVNIQQKKQEFDRFNANSKEIKKGIGIALLFRGESFGAAGQGIDTASAGVSIQPDGSVTINCSIAEVGQGGPSTMIHIVHKTLGVPREKIVISDVDTDYVVDSGPTVATRGTVFSGNAVNDAARKLKQRLTQYAKKRLGTDDVIFEDGFIISNNDPSSKVAFNDVVADVFANCEHLNEYGFFTNPPLVYDKKTGVGEAYMSYVYGASAACVTVDTRTGFVSVDELYAAHDVGCALDIEEVKGQIAGGISMGVGYATLEEVEMHKGRVKNDNLDTYLIATALDMPKVIPIVLEKPGVYGPHGAKGLGEPATSIVAPTITNAIRHATGKPVFHLPANLEQVTLNKKLR